ncbi:MAG: type II secretion system F family protein [Phycisphaeraceae bacterium]
MPRFRYNALDQAGQPTAGELEAVGEAQAVAQLAAQGIFVTQVDAAGHGAAVANGATRADGGGAAAGGWNLSFGARIPLRSRAAMFGQLATALEAGLTLLAALKVVQEQAESESMRRLVTDLADRVQGGEALSGAMEAQGRVFTPLHVSMVRAGETAGVLDEVMGSLAEFAERELEVREKIRSAATYPLIVMTLAVASVIVIMIWVAPTILNSLVEEGRPLPLPTVLLLGVSNFVASWWGVLTGVGLLAGGYWFRQWIATPDGRLAWDGFKLRVPILGETLRKIAVGRFARTLATLTGSGIQILEALHVLRDTLGNEAMARTVDDVRAAISQGESIAEPLRKTGQFPALFIQVIALGEQTGKMDELLLRAANAYERETAAAIERTMTLLPALLIVVLAIVVGLILAAVLLPIVSMQAGV